MKLTLERFGGLAGIPARPLVVDTSAAQPAEARELEALARRALSSELPRSGNADARRDAFDYELTIEEDGKSHCLAFDATHTNDAIQQLVSALRKPATRDR